VNTFEVSRTGGICRILTVTVCTLFLVVTSCCSCTSLSVVGCLNSSWSTWDNLQWHTVIPCLPSNPSCTLPTPEHQACFDVQCHVLPLFPVSLYQRLLTPSDRPSPTMSTSLILSLSLYPSYPPSLPLSTHPTMTISLVHSMSLHPCLRPSPPFSTHPTIPTSLVRSLSLHPWERVEGTRPLCQFLTSLFIKNYQDPTWLLWVLKYLSSVQRFRGLSWVEYIGGHSTQLNSTQKPLY
jgi:hypothetical protein